MIRSSTVSFDFPLAYFLVMLSVFFVNLVAVVYSSAKSFGAHLKQVDKARAAFSNLVGGECLKFIGNTCDEFQNVRFLGLGT